MSRCPKCGTSLHDGQERCPACNSEIPTAAKQCPVCDTQLTNRQEQCPTCSWYVRDVPPAIEERHQEGVAKRDRFQTEWARSHWDEWKNAIDRLSTNNHDLGKTAEDLRGRLAQAEQLLADTKESLERSEEHFRAREIEVAKEKEDILADYENALDQQKTAAENQIEALLAEKKTKETELSETAKQLRQAERRIEDLEAENVDLRSALDQQKMAAENQIEAILAEKKTKETELSETAKQLRQAERRIEDLEAENVDLRSTLDDAKKQLAKSSQRIRQIEREEGWDYDKKPFVGVAWSPESGTAATQYFQSVDFTGVRDLHGVPEDGLLSEAAAEAMNIAKRNGGAERVRVAVAYPAGFPLSYGDSDATVWRRTEQEGVVPQVSGVSWPAAFLIGCYVDDRLRNTVRSYSRVLVAAAGARRGYISVTDVSIRTGTHSIGLTVHSTFVSENEQNLRTLVHRLLEASGDSQFVIIGDTSVVSQLAKVLTKLQIGFPDVSLSEQEMLVLSANGAAVFVAAKEGKAHITVELQDRVGWNLRISWPVHDGRDNSAIQSRTIEFAGSAPGRDYSCAITVEYSSSTMIPATQAKLEAIAIDRDGSKLLDLPALDVPGVAVTGVDGSVYVKVHLSVTVRPISPFQIVLSGEVKVTYDNKIIGASTVHPVTLEASTEEVL
jgi:multidrug efflux pump subunit AcrA (membrane-fusion protein)